MKRALTCLLLMICFCGVVFAQDDASDKTKKALATAAKNGNGLHTQLIVNGNVNAQAVLIPRVDAQRIFGSEIANKYAVIEVNIGNKSPHAALIIHGIFIDYRDWPLSGASSSELSPRPTDPDQASTFPNQVASEEYRVVRGQLLDAQTDTFRNTFLRWLTLAGNLAGAFTFSINEQGIVKGIAAATGVGIPGVGTAWPDKTIEQLNRVSDFGFRANKVIPKQASDVIVCFFPIDRFLTPGFRKLFLKSPALFFAPLQMLADKTVEKDVKAALGPLLVATGVDIPTLTKHLPCYMIVRHPDHDKTGVDVCLTDFGLEYVNDATTGQKKLRVKRVGSNEPDPSDITKFKVFMALGFIASVSLNRTIITVDGVMSVDVNTIAARIDEIDFDKVAECGDDAQCFWTDVKAAGGVRTGVIRGAYLKGGNVALAELEALGSELKKIEDGSTDDELHFSFKLGKRIPNNPFKLHFTVSKDETVAAGTPAKKLESNTWESLAAYSPSATAIFDRTLSGAVLTVKGKGFGATPLVNLYSETGTNITVTPIAGTLTDNKFDIALPTSNTKFITGCWHVQVTAGGLTSNSSAGFSPIDPVPTLDSAIRTNKAIYLKGKDLISLSRCDGPQISFRLNQTGAASIPLTVADWSNGEPELVLPDAAKTGTWRVEVLLGGNPLSTVVDKELKAQSP